ncbi:MAG: 30S ribosomal protein S20 [Proteobacteria bacterium]|nr:30S ribosomal protein S20 [Pseudomonadota bacterium]MBU1717181.1 30S ribosomal protein S20 [Pseudomonadota bacterium]
MANHKSALKRNRQSLVRRSRNRANKTKIKNAVKALDTAIEQKSLEGAQAALLVAIPTIYKASVKGAIHKKNASRKVSRLSRRVNEFAKSLQ